MFRNLSPGAVGVSGTLREILPLARGAGFEGVDPVLSGDLTETQRLLEQHGMKVGCMGLPVDFRRDEETYETGLAGLPATAQRAAQMGCTRCATWLSPASDELTYEQNFQLHVRRLQPAARILQEHGIRFGLEFVAPKTSRDGRRYEFVHRLDQVMELGAAIDTPNMGVLLDAWHWYTSHGSAADLDALTNHDVVLVHVNDAPAGVLVDEQEDAVRDLPGATGVIDIGLFLGALARLGYDGPVTPEPFRGDLRGRPTAEALSIVGQSMADIWATAGLASS